MPTQLLELQARITRCLICGAPIKKGISTGYYFLEDGTETINVYPYCSRECCDKRIEWYANPVFQNREALELFKRKHPQLWLKIKGKPKLFLEKEAGE